MKLLTLHTYIPQDRLRAIANDVSMPDRSSGSVMFADISGFTALTESLRKSLGARQGAEELTKQLGKVYSALIAEIEKYGGSVIGFAGDSMLCWFNEMHGNSSMRAAFSALSMQEAIKEFPELGLKVAIASGDAQRFVVGDEEIQKLDLLAGVTVARTAIGEHLASQGEVLIDEATVKSLGEEIEIVEWRTAEESRDKFAVLGDRKAFDKAQNLLNPKSEMVTPVIQALKPYVHHAVYDRETAGQGSFLTEFRPCVALFVRFMGIDYDSDSAESDLDTFIRTVQSTASRYEGTLMDITIGDKGSYGYVNFGALNAHEDDSRRAVKTALELRNKTELQLQMGITQGLMRVGAYGGETRKVFGALGDDVNLAARLMTTAKENEILLSSHVHKAVMEEFTFEPRPPLPMKGKAEPLPVFAVTGESQKRAVRLQEPNYSLPMVGRVQELGIINDKLDLAMQGKSQVIGIVAEAGLGKSRLVAEVIRNARRKGFVGFGGACQSDGIHTPYLAWKSIWQAFFDVDPEMSERKLMRNIEGEIEDRAPSRLDAMPLLNVVLDLNIPENDFTKNLEPKSRQSALHALLEDCLKAQASDEPTLIVIEDLHWIDARSHDLLEELTKALANHTVCFVLAYRPPQIERLQEPRIEALEQFTRIELHELTTAEAESAVRAKLAQLYPARGGGLPAGLLEGLMRRTQGNPFYLEELLNYVRDRGLDPSDIQNLELPDSLHTLILSRIDQLSEAEKTTLRVASIVGRLFRAEWLTGYYPELGSSPQVKAALDALAGLDITPLDTPEPELAYLFKHIVTHEVTYESLPFATRARLHEQLARYIETRFADQLAGYTPQLAQHFFRAGLYPQAFTYFSRAGDAAFHINANLEAIAHYNQALACAKFCEPTDAELIHVFERKERAHEILVQYDEVLATIDDLLVLAEARQAKAMYLSAYLMRTVIHSTLGPRFDPALGAEFAEKTLALALELDDKSAQARVYWVRMLVAGFAQANLEEAVRLGQLALALARESHNIDILPYILNDLGRMLGAYGQTQAGLARIREAGPLFEQTQNLPMMSDYLNNIAHTSVYAGELTSALEAAEQAIALNRQANNLWGYTDSFWRRALVYLEIGEYALAMADMEVFSQRGSGELAAMAVLLPIHLMLDQIEAIQRVRDQMFLLRDSLGPLFGQHTYGLLALAEIRLGNLVRADEFLQLSHQDPQHPFASIVNLYLAVAEMELALVQDDPLRARVWSDRTEQYYSSKTAKYLKTRCGLLRGKILLRFPDQQAEAVTVLQQARALALQLNDRPNLWQISALLAEHCADAVEKDALLAEARTAVLFIADHAGSPEGRKSFLSRPEVARLL